jgi:putative ABC transport system substrate-binding protein
MIRREFISLLGGVADGGVGAGPRRVRRIGVLMHTSAGEPEAQARLAAFMQGLQELGWAVGRNIRIDYRWSVGDVAHLYKDAAELVALRPEVILAGVGGTVAALQQASRTVPIVYAQGIDPVGNGYAESLARPGRSFNAPEARFQTFAWPRNLRLRPYDAPCFCRRRNFRVLISSM